MELREQTYILAIARHGGIKKSGRGTAHHTSHPQYFSQPPGAGVGRAPLRPAGSALPPHGGRCPLHPHRAENGVPAVPVSGADEGSEGRDIRHHPVWDPPPTHPVSAGGGSWRNSPPPTQTFRSPPLKGPRTRCSACFWRESWISSSTTAPHPDPSLVFLPLYQDRLVMVTAADHPLAGAGVQHPGEAVPWIDLSLFQAETFILASPPQSTRILYGPSPGPCGHSAETGVSAGKSGGLRPAGRRGPGGHL